jgi:hypothetical protein
MGDDHVSLWNSRGLPRGTEPYSSLVDLRDGETIQFSGDFVVDGLNSHHDYLRINDLTESGSMTDPTFVFWYTEVTPVLETSPVHLNRGVPSTVQDRSGGDSLELSADNTVHPSFDCTKARSAAERLICNDPELVALDNRYSASYAKAKSMATDKAALLTIGRKELQRRELECMEKACLVDWYSRMIALMDRVAETPDSTPSDTPGPARMPPGEN